MGTRLYGLIGDPVRHSISPAIHAAAFDSLGVDARYVVRRTAAADLGSALRELARSGGGNVTLPHKEAAAAILDEPTDAVIRSGACNTFWGTPDGRLGGDNTDADAFAASVESLPGVHLRGARVLLLGAGGGARAVLLACRRHEAGEIQIYSRNAERAAAAASLVIGDRLPVSILERPPSSGRYDLVVNATSLGLAPGDPLPIEIDPLEVGALFDLVYGTEGTALTRRAGALGVAARDGLDMLVRQAGLSIRRWLDVDPPLDAMRQAADQALAARSATTAQMASESGSEV